ncbi:hypothetical protein A6M21_14740 [Desulfotomaculum copahuensis]|uniref:DUF3243 domain-containing protein n=1 Tax=Desulfotomaculum copahuensis TaxID=1838280 RepID=A0A1B7LBK1_9FIRM|nr:DUF3243 domain-containing protein [Desulfotomaculum copahuensis]OAT79854.1 hypothetical protein A6M21_14740 [Desulfotomaculum copahuensis]
MDIQQVNTDWENWKRFLGQAVEFAEELGVSRERITNLAQQAGQVLADNVTPANPEQKALKELWTVADQQERQMLANLMTKLVANRPGSYAAF